MDEILNLIVIDDGSSDGTAEFLDSQNDICVLKGDGNLWWGGAIEIALQHVLKISHPSDWVLLVNNDTLFSNDFIQRLLNVGRSEAPAAVGSVICDETSPDKLLSIGAILDPWRLRVRDKLSDTRLCSSVNGLYSVDALSGRGTLYPTDAFRMAGTMRPVLLPHYLADYELAVRVKKAGFKLFVTEDAKVLSSEEFGNAYLATRLLDKFFSIRSAYYLPAVLAFWWSMSSFFEKLTLIPRLIFVALKSKLLSS